MDQKANYSELIFGLVLEIQSKQIQINKLEEVNKKNFEFFEKKRERVSEIQEEYQIEKDKILSINKDLEQDIKEKLELIKSLKEKIEIMEHTITNQNNDLEILKKSLKEKDFNSNDFKILNEENELLIDKIKRLEENERNQTLKYQKSIADFNNKINSLKNDYNRAVENFERLQNDFEQQRQVSDSLFKKNTDLKNENDEIRQQNKPDYYKEKYWKIKDDFEKFLVEVNDYKHQLKDKPELEIQLKRDVLQLENQAKMIDHLKKELNQQKTKNLKLSHSLQKLLAEQKLNPKPEDKLTARLNELESFETIQGKPIFDFVRDLEDQNNQQQKEIEQMDHVIYLYEKQFPQIHNQTAPKKFNENLDLTQTSDPD